MAETKSSIARGHGSRSIRRAIRARTSTVAGTTDARPLCYESPQAVRRLLFFEVVDRPFKVSIRIIFRRSGDLPDSLFIEFMINA